jgi:hypothetical protein
MNGKTERFENRVAKRILRPKREEAIGSLKKL